MPEQIFHVGDVQYCMLSGMS